MVIQSELPAFDSVQLGTTSNVRPDINLRRIHGIMLQVQGVGAGATVLKFEDTVEYVSILQDGKLKQLFKPLLWKRHAAYLNANADALPNDFLWLPFSRPGLIDSFWGTGDIKQLQISCKLKSAVPVGASFSRLEGWISYSPLQVPEPRGAVVLAGVVSPQVPVAGWNKVSDLPVSSIVSAMRMCFCAADPATGHAKPITQVKISVGEVEVFNQTKAAAIAAVAHNPLYKVPDNAVHGDIDNFPVLLDVLGVPGEFVPLVQGGVRRPLNVEYYWDSTLGAPVPIEVVVEGVEPGAPSPTVNAA